jgi:hypothetical protein
VRFPDPLPANVDSVLRRIAPDDLVLDVGGWWKPFNRADHVVDLLSYETRGGGGSIGPGPERFSEQTWHQRDICADGLPFPDGMFNFAYCGQTLEDVRDPVAVCRELCRVARAGYIEVPSLWIECCFDVDALPNSDRYPGYEKHRWLVYADAGELLFIPKLVWLGLYEFVHKDVFERHRGRQELWTTPWHWDGSISAREWSFAGQEELVPFLRSYFESFDHGLRAAETV